MNVKRVIIKTNKSYDHQVFEETLRLSINAEYDIRYIDKYTFLEIYDFEDSFSKLNTILDILNQDFSTSFTILLVPKFDDFMIKLLDYINGNGIYNAYQVLTNLLIKNEIKKDD